MSSAEERFNPSQSKAAAPANASPSAPAIETVYTTVESQADRTDWLTVVSNLRQINRQLVEQIARLEQALASAKQELHNHKEENQNHEITILQQQDELKIARDRVGALFQQLENSHQIGQRQQILVETISQQLEIAQTIIPQLEAENEDLNQKYQQQSQQLHKTEQVATELYRRLKVQAAGGQTATTTHSNTATTTPDPNSAPAESIPTATTNHIPVANPSAMHTPALVTEEIIPITADLSAPEPIVAQVETTLFDRQPTTPTPIYLPQPEMPTWTPTTEILAQQTNPAPPKSSPQTSWREAIANNNAKHIYQSNPDPTPTSPATADLDQTTDDQTIKPSPNWPAPTLDRSRPVAKTVTIDLPKFPKKQDG